MLAIFALVVSRLDAKDAITWVMVVLNQVFGVLLAVVVYFFGKNKNLTNTDDDEPEGPAGGAGTNVRPLPSAPAPQNVRQLKGKAAKSQNLRQLKGEAAKKSRPRSRRRRRR
jgi:hypothetical protein